MELDPLVFGNAREGFARFIRNGETAVFVEAQTDQAVDSAATTLKHYTPITIEVVPLAERPAKTSGLGTAGPETAGCRSPIAVLLYNRP